MRYEDPELQVTGPRGSLCMRLHNQISLARHDDSFLVQRKTQTKASLAMAGTTRALVANMMTGVSQGFEKRLQLQGVGYRAQAHADAPGRLSLALGFSHPVIYNLPPGVEAELPSQTELIIRGIDKQQIGQVAAEIRAFRPPEPYKGKGIRYLNESVRRKEKKKK